MSAALSNLPTSTRAAAAILVLGLTGGSDDEWLRLQRNWRVAFMGVRVALFAARLAMPLVMTSFVRRWASGRRNRR